MVGLASAENSKVERDGLERHDRMDHKRRDEPENNEVELAHSFGKQKGGWEGRMVERLGMALCLEVEETWCLCLRGFCREKRESEMWRLCEGLDFGVTVVVI